MIARLLLAAVLAAPAAARVASGGPAVLGGPDGHGLDVLREGQFLEVRGELNDDGVFVAGGAELAEPDDDVLIGTVERRPHRDGRFFLWDQEVAFSAKTEWQGVHADALEGARVKVEGRWRGPRKFSARKISTRGAGRDRIAARIDSIEPVEGGVRVRLMRWTVFLADDVEVECEVDPASLELLPARPVATLDDNADEDDLFGDGIALPYDLSFFAQLELESLYEDEFDLNDAVDRDRFDALASARLRLVWEPTERFTGMVSVRSSWLRRDDQDGDAYSDPETSISETWGWWRDALGKDVDLVVGRQDFDDEREWIYDQNLDAIRAIVRKPGWRLDLSASTTLDGGTRDEHATNLIAYLSNDDDRRHLALYGVRRDITEPIEETPLHLGARALGEWVPQNDLWVELVGLSGERAGDRLSAYAFDVGTTWEPPALAPLAFTLGYAFASGDASPGGTDHGFRQTGLQDNNDKLSGVTSFRYYGEVLDPELANLRVLTAGIGARIAERTSLDLIFHHYRQDEAFAGLADSDLKAQPNGSDGDLGTEIDLVLGSRRFEAFDLECVLGWFRPGNAFDNDDDALLGKIQLRYRL